MACNSCKKRGEKIRNKSNLKEKNITKSQKIRNYFFNFLLFLILALIIVPISVPLLIYVLFKSIVLEKKINVYPFLLFVAKKIVQKYGDVDEEDEEYDDEDDDEDFDEEKYDYELENPDDIVEIKSK